MERMPGPSADWVRKRKGDRVKVEVVQVDPNTGVTTIWAKHLKYFRESRIDQLPHSGLYRCISRSAKPGTIPEQPSYAIEAHHSGIHKHIALERAADGLGLGLKLHIIDESEPNHFFVNYQVDHLRSIGIHHNSMDLDAIYQSLKARPLGANLLELGEFYRNTGAVATFNPSMGVVGPELDGDQRLYLDWAQSETRWKRDKIMKNWTDEERARVIIEVGTIVKGAVTQHLGQDFQQPDLETLTSGLMDAVLVDLPFDFDTKEGTLDRLAVIADLVVRNTAMLVTANRQKYAYLSDFTANLYFSPPNREEIGIEIEDFEYEPIHRDSLRFGERYRYEDYDYLVTRDNSGRVTTRIVRILGRTTPLQVTVREEIDLEALTKLLTTPESIGWEKALRVADIELQKG